MKSITTGIPYANPEQEAYLRNLQSDLFRHVELLGEEHGHKSLPATVSDMQALVISRITATIQSGMDDNRKRHLLDSGIAVAKKILADAEGRITQLDAAIFDIRHKLPRLEQLREQLKPNLQRAKWRTCTYYGAGVIAIAEGVFTYEAVRHAHFPVLPALVTACAVAAAIGLGVHIMGGWIKKSKTRLQRITRYCVALVPAFIGFAALGSLRADAYNSIRSVQLNPNEVFVAPHVSGWPITIISFLLFVAALLFSIKYYRTQQEEKQEQDYRDACKEIGLIEQEIQAKEQEKQRVNGDATAQAAEALARYEYAGSIEAMLVTAARQAFEIYKEKNLRHRKDVPVFFSYPPVFHFNFYFKSLKEKAHEKDTASPDAAYVQ